MSIKIMSQVWSDGPSDKSEILLLLALADFCNDEGECWPAVDTIAKKARMTSRGVQKISARLVEAGWLEIDLRKGRHGCNLFRIKTPNPVHPEHGSPPNTVRQNPEPRSENPEPRSPKPSRTVKEPSFNISEIEEAVSEYNATAQSVGWPIVQKLSQKRKTALSARLKDVGGIEGWHVALEKAAASPFLTGQNNRGWTADFDFLCKSDKFTKLMEGGYDNRTNPSQSSDATLRAIAAAAGAF